MLFSCVLRWLLEMEFYQVDPKLENYWRAIILFGRNVASYKFALAKALYDLQHEGNDLITLDQLARPYSKHICEHLSHSPKQITSSSSKFLEACRSFNAGNLSQDELSGYTVKLGFNNVIDAFHIVNQSEISCRFFLDERKGNKGIRITDEFRQLSQDGDIASLANETEARWRLVEQGWKLGLSRSLINVEYDQDLSVLFTTDKRRRVDVTSCRDSLNGYQKGRCFFCFDTISTVSGQENLGQVDHFFPWSIGNLIPNINGLWNLSLSCSACNGSGEKGSKVPSVELLHRLHKRNEYLINSHLPLRETLISQTGKTQGDRAAFLQRCYKVAKEALIHEWEPNPKESAVF